MNKETQKRTEPTLDREYNPRAVESKWQERWLKEGTYAYEGTHETDPNSVYVIDTPPPTVSGSMHVGTLYGHLVQDFAARFHRMHDGDVLFPFGYDDNGIASERLTEKELDIRHQEYDRREFQRRCREVCQTYEASFTEKLQSAGCSIDWNHTYKTIEPRVQRIAQLSFLDLYEKGREYRKKAPAIWCPDCETAISQVEMEDAERDSHFNDIAFEVVGADSPREELVISTTRPELLPACVAVFVHPDDETNQDLVGETVRVPVFGHEVSVVEDGRVDREKGTGVVMCCTFGDQTDVEWYHAHDLPLRVAIDESATMTDLAGEYEGLSTEQARGAIVADLDAVGALRDRREITHTVGVHERCETPVEFRVTRQWYVEILDHTEAYLDAGREMDWYPEKMFSRYRHWIEGLEWDWLISRQRDSGIPFPVWYCGDCDEPIVAHRADLPVDPLSDEPPVDACPECGSETFVPEDDVFDTWATSSLTPLINAGWDWDENSGAFAMERPECYPVSLRPQGHDIISFWLFHTVVKCYEHTGEVPFDAVLINGHVLDENREKMSKSKGNVVEPSVVLEEYPVDAVRFWAASAAVGDDFPFSESDIVAGEKLLRKLWNASKLVERLALSDADTADGIVSGETATFDPDGPETLDQIDRWLLAELDAVITDLTAHLEAYEFAKARNRHRTFFWNTFCDDYLEIAKQRAGSASMRYTLLTAHRTFLLLWAPYLPHVTEELWHALYGESSVHRESWPEPVGYDADHTAGETALAVIGALRRYKTERGLALNAPLDSVGVHGDCAGFEDTIADAMHVERIERLAESPATTEVVGIDLDYASVGPEYGERVADIEAAIADGAFDIQNGELHATGVTLSPEQFEVREEVTHAGEGTLLEAGDALVVVR